MSKFNTKTRTTETNHAGGTSFLRKDAKSELIGIVVNSMMNRGSFYEGEPKRIQNVTALWTNLVMKNEFEFLIKLIVYTRTKMNLRSISHLMAVLAIESIKGVPALREGLRRLMIRPDDATEIVALWNQRHPEVNIPNSLRRAIRDKLENDWDAYRLKKYYGTGTVKVPDLIKLSHPSASDKAEMFKQALEGNLPNIDTAQTVNAGTAGEQRAEAYNEMLRDGKLGLMAALKNIKNIVEAELNTTSLNMLSELLGNETAIKRSKVLPFRFYQAYDVVGEISTINKITKNKLLAMIEDGFSKSAGNLGIVEPHETVAFMLDESASMTWTPQLNDMTPFDIGKVMMAATMSGVNKDNAIGLLWASHTRQVDINSKPLQFCKETRATAGGTNLGQAIDVLVDSNTFVDMMVVYTDMQISSARGASRAMEHYMQTINPKLKVVFWNLEGYGGGTPLQIRNGIVEVSGFSEKMIEMIPLLIQDKDALIQEIMKVKI